MQCQWQTLKIFLEREKIKDKNLNTRHKILVIRFSSIGDIVLTTPVVRALKVQLDDAEVHFCTKPAFLPVVEHNPYLDKVILLDKGLPDLIKKIKKEKYTCIIDLHKNLRTRIIRWSVLTKYYTFDKINFEKWLYVNLKINRLPPFHIVDRYFKAIKHLHLKPDTLGLDYFIPDKDIVERAWLPVSHRKSYVAVALGGEHYTKKLPYAKLIELCNHINRPIILLGGQKELEMAEKIYAFFHGEHKEGDPLFKEKINGNTQIFHACGKLNLHQSASLIKGAEYVFTHDTGLMHIAAAFKKEIYSIWGNTVPEFGMYPYRTKFTIFENKGLDCRPCSKIGYSGCPRKHFKCMRDIKFDFYLE